MSHTCNAESPRKHNRALFAALLATKMLTSPLLGQIPAYAAQATAPAKASLAPSGFADIIAKASPAVVSVLVKKNIEVSSAGPEKFPDQIPDGLKKFFKRFGMPDEGQGSRGGQPPQNGGRRMMGQGSGFFISADGYIVTNNHVVSASDDIEVRMTSGNVLKAKLVGTDPKTDLAVLKAEGHNFPYVAFGGSDGTRVGDWVVVVGSPFGLAGTTTAGIVSARGRDIGSGPYDDFIQIDAPINQGNSGGPTFNDRGQVIGVNTAIYSPSGGSVGIGFAIPANIAKEVVAKLIADGVVHRGWLGVSIQPVSDDIAASLGLTTTQGSLIASVSDGSPAARAGLKSGDIVMDVDGTSIKSPRDLSRIIAGKGPTRTVALKLWRDGNTMTLKVSLKEQPNQKVAMAKTNKAPGKAQLGLMLQNTDKGVVIAQVVPGSIAEEKGLASGDTIEQVAGKNVRTADDVRQAVAEATKKGKDRILLLVSGTNGKRFVALKFGRSMG